MRNKKEEESAGAAGLAGAFRRQANPRVAPLGAAYPEELRAILSLSAHEAARREIAAWPGYAPTPLRDLPGLAKRCGVGRVWLKDEAPRFGLGSFKALGGAYGVLRVLQRALEAKAGRAPSAAELAGDAFRDAAAGVTVTCATDGNHGRSVAWGARTFGARSVIYLHEGVSAAREAAIAGYGARIVRTSGNYDASVRACDRDAQQEHRTVVSDTSYPGYDTIPRDVMQGYTVLAAEIMEQLPRGEGFTHLFVQGGVGGLAAALCAHFWEALGERRPRTVVVEPEKADCLYRSAAAGRPVTVEGELDTIMAGLACGEVSELAWAVLERGASDFVTVADAAAEQAMRQLAQGACSDAPFVQGESGVAGLAGLLAAAEVPAARAALGLGADAKVLLIGTEGATDPELFERIVGMPAQSVGVKPTQ
ncbi:MAG: diaminopropionate ammonia-lyase [Planctomycetes bacterium]|nr:diaminopropionate ammonia-lyase [Planctomycetota bacterium]